MRAGAMANYANTFETYMHQLGRGDEARMKVQSLLEEAIEIDPRHEHALSNLGRLYSDTQQYSKVGTDSYGASLALTVTLFRCLAL